MKTTDTRRFLILLGCIAFLFTGATFASALSVTASMPKGEVKDLARITVRFDEAMRALGAMEDTAENAPLRLSAVGGKLPPGNFRWLDPFTLAYLFDEPVSFPVTIIAEVPQGTRSLAGKTLGKSVSWEVRTPPLTFELYNRAHTAALPPKNATVYIQSNYPLRTSLLREKLRASHQGSPVPLSVAEAPLAEFGAGRPSRWRYAVTVKSVLSPDSSVIFSVGQGVTAENGGIPAEKFSKEIPTHRTLHLESWSFSEAGAERDVKKSVPPESLVFLALNNPVPLQEALRHITVSPEAKPFLSGEQPGSSAHMRLPYLWEPRTTYTVTLKKGLADTYGTVLPKDETFTFTTGDYRPLAHIPGENDAVLETPLAHIFPVTLRNAGKITVSLRYIPWGEEALAFMRDDALTPAKQADGARETEIILDVTGKPNATIRETLDIPKALGFSSAAEMNGLVALTAHGDVFETSGREKKTHLQFTGLGLALRLGEKRGLAWAADLAHGKPVPNASIQITDMHGASLWKGKTDDSGVAVLPGYEKILGARFCIAESPEGTSVLELGKYLVPASAKEHETAKSERIPWRIHAIAQLPLYRAGQEVNAALIARHHADSGKSGLYGFADWQAIAGTPVSIEVRDRRNTVVHAAKGVTDTYGVIPFSFTLSPSAEHGWYTVTATTRDTRRKSSVYAFRVASFRPPDVKVDLTPPVSQPVPVSGNERLAVDAAAAYFSGSPVRGGSVSLEVSEQAAFFAPSKLRGYRVGPELQRYYHRYQLPRTETVSGRLDGHGRASLTLPAFTLKNFRPSTISLIATVTDNSRLTTQGTASFMLHPCEYYVGLRASLIALPGKNAVFHLKAATWDDNALLGKTVTVSAKRLAGSNGEIREIPVWERSVTLEKETGDSFEASFAESGEYRVTALIRDAAGRENIAEARVYVPGPGGDWIHAKPGRRLEFLHEDTVYAPGQTARFIVKNPFATATALVTLERDGVLRSFVTEVSGDAPLIEVPLEKTDAPYVYATVTLAKGRTAPPPDTASPAESAEGSAEGSADEGAPALAQGALLLKVSGAREKLSATVVTDKKEYRPGGTVKTEVSVTNGAGKGVKSQVTLLAVDERYLRAAGERTLYDPTATFGEQFPNAVQNADIWKFILNRAVPVTVHDERGFRAAMRIATAAGETLAAPNQESGEEGAFAVRSDFTPLAFWLAAKETDDSGKLAASFTLPDSITGYRIVAVAYDAKSAFTLGETSITAAKPLQILSALPQFVTEGDRLLAAVLVRNTSREPGEITVTGSATGNASGPVVTEARAFRLEAGESKRISFPVDAGSLSGAEGFLQLDFTAKMRAENSTETDAARFVLPVKPALPLTTVAAAGILAENETFTLPVSVPQNPGPRGRIVVTFAPSPAAGVPLAAKQVVEYPWNCLEQRLSRAWARILRVRHGELLGLASDPADMAKISEELKAVPAYQKNDGSFGLWPGGYGSGPRESSGLFLASYALFVDNAAKSVGKAFPGETTAKALAYVEKQLSSAKNEENAPPDVMAFALHALSLHAPEKSARFFPGVWAYCRTAETTPFGYAALIFSLQAAKMPEADTTLVALYEAIEKTAAVTATETHFASPHETAYWRTFGSRLRDNAYVLAALSFASPGYPHLESLARWVGQRLGDAKTLSTQEGVFGMWGLASYLQGLGGNRKITVTALWNNQDEVSFSFKRLADAPVTWVLEPEKLHGGNESGLRLTAGAGRPYWTARLRYASLETAMKGENAGFAITRTFGPGETSADEAAPGNAGAGKAGAAEKTGEKRDSWKIGDTARVTLTVTVPATRRHVALFDPFPAGFEPLFASRVDMGANVADARMARQSPWDWQDALDDGMLLYAENVDPGTYTFTYTLRAAAGGSFVLRPARVEEMYTPETSGGTGIGSVTVTEE